MNHVAGNHPRTTALLTAVGRNPTAAAIFLRPRAFASAFESIMGGLYPPFVDNGNTTNGGLLNSPHFVKLPVMAQGESEFSEIGARLLRVREAFSDLSQKAWAEKHNFQPTQWNNWEKGTRRIPVENAERLCALCGLSLDFIYRGRVDALSEKAAKAL